MDFILLVIDFILHIDRHLGEIIQNYGMLTYLILFCIIFLETGLVVTPFLPGDSLLFAAGAFAALDNSPLSLAWLLLLLITAAIMGDALNYFIGKKIGHTIIQKGWIKQNHIDKTHKFYEKHGGKTIIIARFMPIVRTVAPFVAGIGEMRYLRFATYNVIGGVFWVAAFLCLGYFFGNIPGVKNNFGLVIIAIIILSVLPAIYGWIQARKKH